MLSIFSYKYMVEIDSIKDYLATVMQSLIQFVLLLSFEIVILISVMQEDPLNLSI